MQAFTGLSQIGAECFVGLAGSYANTREITPLIAAVALSAQVGSAFTAEIGAMRISDEIDALEVMSIPSLTYLVCTRLVAMVVALIPLYLVALFTSFFGTRLVTTDVFGMSPGLYDYYFHLYLPPIDILYSLIKVIVFAVEVEPHPLLLRLLRQRRAGRRRAGRRHRHPDHDHRGRPHQPAAVVPVLGRHLHREPHRMTAQRSPSSSASSSAWPAHW